jgi:hypothetical protein
MPQDSSCEMPYPRSICANWSVPSWLVRTPRPTMRVFGSSHNRGL